MMMGGPQLHIQGWVFRGEGSFKENFSYEAFAVAGL